jgi:signal-transduction protein with cAMP-binding, CBS, and nucleotidyltransferase domain
MMKKVKLLQVLSGSEIEELAALCSLETYRDGDKIVTQGEMGQTFYMLKSGKATVTRERAKVELKEVRI